MFADGVSDHMVSVSPVTDLTRNVAKNDDATLASFFSRPVIINTGDWTPFNPAPFSFIFNPWTTFLTNKRVANRITNYRLASMKLKVKIMINGNSFYYGRLMADYVPLHLVDTCTLASPLIPANAVTASQRMNLFIDPTTSQGGTFELPFVWPHNMIDLTLSEYDSLGQIIIRELSQLRHASGSTIPLNMTIAIWAEDVSLAAPTTRPLFGLVPQSDEHSVGPISTAASAVANVSGKLSSVPYIGPYAKATSMMMTGLSMMARLFGFSRPIILDNYRPIRPHYIGNLANCDAADSSVKLSVDSKQELTIDTRVCGADMGDELVLHKLASVPSYIRTFAWSTSAARDDLLYNARVTPNVVVAEAGIIHRPAMQFVAHPFAYWRGTIRYRFQIVASAFHRGRIRIVYDPLFISSLESGISFTKIVDLASERDFTIDVAWASPSTWLRNGSMVDAQTTSSTSLFNTANEFTNGVLGIYVLNPLTSSDNSVANDITINVFASMTDDAKFAVPRQVDAYVPIYNMTPQSFEFQSDAYDSVSATDDSTLGSQPISCINNCIEDDQSDLVYMGETLTSFRQLLKRYEYYKTYGDYNTGNRLFRIIDCNFSPYVGYSLTSITTTVSAGRWEYANRTLLNYLTPAFVGVRGGVRVKYVISGPGGVGADVACLYRNAVASGRGLIGAANVNTNQSQLAWRRSGGLSFISSTGSIATVPRHQPVIEAELPYQVKERFAFAKSVSNNNAAGFPTAVNHRLDIITPVTGEISVDRLQSVAEDFTLFWFCGAPPVVLMAVPLPSTT